jgi:hypothetical protein
MIMEYCIIFDCEQCEGTGEYTVRHGSVDRNGPWITDHSVSCTQCGGHGEGGMYNVNADLYESIEDVAKDYPQYRTIEVHQKNESEYLFKALPVKYGKH